MGRIKARFVKAFGQALPHLSEEEIFWRMHFTIGSMAHTLASRGLLEFISGGKCSPTDVEEARRQLIQYAVGGLRAPSLAERS